MIVNNQAVFEADDSLCPRGHVRGMCHQDYGDPVVGVEITEEGHDFDAARAVKVSGRLVGHDEGGPVDQCASYCHSLLLTSRQLIGFVIHAFTETDFL